MQPLSMYIDALAHDMVARKKNSVVNIVPYFLKIQKLVVHHDTIVLLRSMIANLCTPNKGFLVLGLLKTCREQPSAE